MKVFGVGAFDDSATTYQARTAVLSATAVLLLVVVLSVLVIVADETEFVWNLDGPEAEAPRRGFRVSVFLATLLTFISSVAVLVSLLSGFSPFQCVVSTSRY